ncbi:MAG: HNH endonuclease [Psychroserpens sp.]|nr:HNH endonuclease [Psychroserpens sp.]
MREIKFLNTCNCIVDTNELQKAVIWMADKSIYSVKKIFMHGNYPGVSVGNRKIHVHRLLMNYWNGRELTQHQCVHHINHNKLDARKENLEIIERSHHQSMHNANKVLSNSHKEKISNANKKRKGISKRYKLDLPNEYINRLYERGMSITEIAKKYNVGWSSIKERIHYKELKD